MARCSDVSQPHKISSRHGGTEQRVQTRFAAQFNLPDHAARVASGQQLGCVERICHPQRLHSLTA